MRRLVIACTAALLVPIPALAGNPVEDFFRYEGPPVPRSRDCGQLNAAIGPAAVWHGEFSGKRYDSFTERYQPYATQGCFESEIACRIWQGQATSVTEGGPIYYTSCRRGDDD